MRSRPTSATEPLPLQAPPKRAQLVAGMVRCGMSFRARISHGRIVVDEPVDLPEGTVLDLVVDDEGDDLDDAEREALHAQLARSFAEATAGKTRPVTELLAELRAR